MGVCSGAKMSYKAILDEICTSSPLGQTTAMGLYVMAPPQARPVHPTDAVSPMTWRMRSNPSADSSGVAMP